MSRTASSPTSGATRRSTGSTTTHPRTAVRASRHLGSCSRSSPTTRPTSAPQAPGASPIRDTNVETPEQPAPGSVVGDCGDFDSHCASGYTFMRGGTQVRATADQQDKSHDYVYVLYDPSIPGTEVASGTTYGSVTSEDLPDKYHQNVGSQSGIYFFRLDGPTGAHTAAVLIDDPRGHGGLQRFPDISVDAGSMHAIWWDSRNDACYDPRRPLGNCADRTTVPSID